jgi:hypothetical protein
VVFLLILAAVIIGFGILLLEIRRVDKRASKLGYGPPAQLGGQPCAQGRLVCVSVDAPTLGRDLSFEYSFRLHTDGTNATGTYDYQRGIANYSGEVFLSLKGGRVKGRSLMGGFRSVEGSISPNQIRLLRGYPEGSLLRFINGPYEFSIRNGRVYFDNTTRAGSVSSKSELRIEGNRISGRVLHGPQTTWGVEVDVTFAELPEEAVVLAIVLSCDDILSFHHD